jgi:hypothetical protein
VDAAGEPHVEPLLNRLEEIHHELLRDVVAAEGERVLVVLPVALDQLDIRPSSLK